MAFVIQCPFCSLRARVPDRANGAVGRCPKCANSFTLAPADDQRLPEGAHAGGADPSEIEPIDSGAVGVAIAVAAAAAKDPAPADFLHADAPQRSAAAALQPAAAAAAGALALLISGCALICGSISSLRGSVLPMSGLALLTGLTAIAAAWFSARSRLLLPITGTAAALAMLIVAWLFPSLLWPGYLNTQQRRDPPPAGLHAVPLAGAPKLADVPEWVDANRYSLQRDGLRVQVVYVSILPPAAPDGKTPPASKERLLVCVRVSRDLGDARPLERGEKPAPTLTDDMGKSYALQRSEFVDRGGGAGKRGLAPIPTIDETFVFDAPAEEQKSLRLELPAARWKGVGVFQFTISDFGVAAPQQQDK
jgi:hypothetical protein